MTIINKSFSVVISMSFSNIAHIFVFAIIFSDLGTVPPVIEFSVPVFIEGHKSIILSVIVFIIGTVHEVI